MAADRLTMATSETSKTSSWQKLKSKFSLPYPLSTLENNPHCKFLEGEIGHYIFFWTCAGCIGGLAVGMGSFYRQYRYIKWTRKQPLNVQLALLEKNNMKSAEGGIATPRFSSLPKAIDTRVKLPYSSEYRPYQWYEWGPLKLWNNLGDYPWASQAWIEVGKWSIRLSLLTGATMAFESLFCFTFGYPLGTNAYIRGSAGLCTGYLLAKMASEGVLFWYQTLGFALGLGALWAGITLYDPNWGEMARNNQFVIEMYSHSLHQSVNKHYKSKELTKQLYHKDRQQKAEIFEEFLKMKEKELLSENGDIKVDDVDLVATATGTTMQQLQEHWLTGMFFRKGSVEIPPEIDEMPYEQRKQLEREAIGGSMAVEYDKYPLKLFAKPQPQFYFLDAEVIRNESDTAQIVQEMHSTECDAAPDRELTLEL